MRISDWSSDVCSSDLVPGAIMALVFIAWAVFKCSRAQAHIQRDPRASPAEMLQALRKAMWSIALPVFVLGGMYLGVFTATEAEAAGVWLACFVTRLIYRSIGWRELRSEKRGGGHECVSKCRSRGARILNK